jgi:hypothetical protein
MIRKLSSGKYRLYSRKKNRRPGSAVIWARSRAAPPPSATSARCSISNGIKAASGLTNPAAIRSPFRRLAAHDLLN